MNKNKYIMDTIKGFPPLPAVVTKLMNVTADPKSSIDDVLAIINIDPALAAETLKLANSPLFGRMAGVCSIKEALSVLGFTEIRNLVLSKAVFNNFRHVDNLGKRYIKNFWEHSFLCGLAAKTVAEDFNEKSSDCFICGLLHDIGKLIFYQALPEDFIKVLQLAQQQQFGTYKEELEIIGITHDQSGYALLKRWMFPKTLLIPVRFHHSPQDAKKSGLYPAIINVADTLTHCVMIAAQNPANAKFPKSLITQANIDLFRQYDIKWDVVKLKQYIDKLIDLKEKNEETLRLFLS